MTSIRQPSKFYELSQEMFFNILIHKPDSSVFDFVTKYFPYLAKPFKPGGWTIYPAGTPPVLQYTIHSLKFTRHPYFDAKFREGRLDILSSEEKDKPAGPTDFHLWFIFDKRQDALKAFEKLSKMFKRISKSKNIYRKNGKTIVEYSEQAEFDYFNSVQFILTKDELHNNKYKLFFRLGSFTYLTDNDWTKLSPHRK